MVKNLPANVGDIRDVGSIPVRKIPWRRAWQPTPILLTGEPPWTELPGRLQIHRVSKSWTQMKLFLMHAHNEKDSHLQTKKRALTRF